MTMYEAQENKDADLRAVLTYLVNHSTGDLNSEMQKAYGDAATRLRAVLDIPVAEPALNPFYINAANLWFQPEDVTVVVVAPEGVMGKDMPRMLFLGPNDQPELDTLSPFTRLVVGALLDQAREQLDG